MRRRYLWLGLGVSVVLAGVLVALSGRLPDIARRVAVGRLQAMTSRAVSIERVDLELLRGRVTIHGARILDRDGATTLATFGRFDARLHLPSLLVGHVWIRDLTIADSTVNVVRYTAREFNISDLVARTGKTGRPLDVTVDRFVVTGGTVNLEDRVLTPQRTWVSERIEIEARDLSTRRGDGTASGTSVTAGAPVTVRVEGLRLHPIQLRATVTVAGLDLALARLYTPPEAALTADRGRLGATIALRLDAREGLRMDGDVRVADAVLVKPGGTEPVITTPAATVTVTDLTVGTGTVDPGAFRLARLEVAGSGSLFDRRVSPARRYEVAGLRAAAEGLSWPIVAPARVSVVSGIPGGGRLEARGTARVQPAAADLRVRVSGAELAPWSQFLPGSARFTGTVAADLAITARLEGRAVARASGTASLIRLTMNDGERALAKVERIDATGIGWDGPAQLTVDRVVVRRPSALVERDESGRLRLTELLGRDRGAAGLPSSSGPAQPSSPAPAMQATVREVRIQDGVLSWHDRAVKPASRADITGIQLVVSDAGWPLRGPLPVALKARAAGGGTLDLNGRVAVDPAGAEVRVVLRGVDVAPYQPYLALPVTVSGRSSADLDVAVSRVSPLEARVRGKADLSRLAAVRDGTTVMSIARAEAAGIVADWPERVSVERMRIERPVAHVERTADGRIPLRELLTRRSGAATSADNARPATDDTGESRTTVDIGRLVVTQGAARFVDRTVRPAYVEDLSALDVQLSDLTTAAATPARVRLRGRVGPTGALEMQGTVAAFGGPLTADVTGRLSDFTVTRVNPYLERLLAWSARDGRLFVDLSCRLRGDALEARNEIRLARLKVERAGAHDEARDRIGLPLGLIVALMKDPRGNIQLSLPIGGRLNDPRFEVREAIWGAVRAITIHTITAPLSWIGRVHFTPDSKIQDISVDPAGFEPGSIALTSAGEEQVGRVVSFLRRLPEARMVLTPVITLGDIERLKHEKVRTRIERLARERGVPAADAAAQVFAQQFPGRESPPALDDIVLAVAADTEAPEAAANRLAKDRLAAVRSTLKEAGIDPARLQANKDTEGLEVPDGGRVEFGLTDQVKPRRHLLAELLRKLKALLARVS